MDEPVTEQPEASPTEAGSSSQPADLSPKRTATPERVRSLGRSALMQQAFGTSSSTAASRLIGLSTLGSSGALRQMGLTTGVTAAARKSAYGKFIESAGAASLLTSIGASAEAASQSVLAESGVLKFGSSGALRQMGLTTGVTAAARKSAYGKFIESAGAASLLTSIGASAEAAAQSVLAESGVLKFGSSGALRQMGLTAGVTAAARKSAYGKFIESAGAASLLTSIGASAEAAAQSVLAESGVLKFGSSGALRQMGLTAGVTAAARKSAYGKFIESAGAASLLTSIGASAEAAAQSVLAESGVLKFGSSRTLFAHLSRQAAADAFAAFDGIGAANLGAAWVGGHRHLTAGLEPDAFTERDLREGVAGDFDWLQRVYIANFVFVVVLLLLVGEWLQSANSAGDDVTQMNVMEMASQLTWTFGTAGAAWASVMYPERVWARIARVALVVINRESRQ